MAIRTWRREWVSSMSDASVPGEPAVAAEMQEFVDRMLAPTSLAGRMGIQARSVAPGSAAVEVAVGPEHVNQAGYAHGGLLFTLADTALGLAACRAGGRTALGTSFALQILRSSQPGDVVRAQAEEVHRGRSMVSQSVTVVRVRDGALVATMSAQMMLTGDPGAPTADAGPCGFCGVDLAAVEPNEVGSRVAADTDALIALLRATPDRLLRVRPSTDRWSAAEYCGHVADVHTLFADRIRDMLTHTAPALTVWDHDRRVLDERYNDLDAERLGQRLLESSARLRSVADSLGPGDLARDGWRGRQRRTVRTVLARAVHETHHHLQDAARAVAAADGAR